MIGGTFQHRTGRIEVKLYGLTICIHRTNLELNALANAQAIAFIAHDHQGDAIYCNTLGNLGTGCFAHGKGKVEGKRFAVDQRVDFGHISAAR